MRTIHRDLSFDDPRRAIEWLTGFYRRDRTEGQVSAVYLGVEKHGIVEQLRAWFGDYGVRIVSLGGYASQTYVDDIARDAKEDGRLAVLIYAGDWDPSGEDIPRDFEGRCPVFSKFIRVALNENQVSEFGLPENPGKHQDPRAGRFEARYGRLAQVEVDALPPDVLRDLFADALSGYVDMYESILRLEELDRETLREGMKND